MAMAMNISLFDISHLNTMGYTHTVHNVVFKTYLIYGLLNELRWDCIRSIEIIE